MGRTAALLLVTLFLGLGPQRVHAQEPTEEEPPAEYMELIQEAVTESAAQRWVEAHGLFREAQQVFPNARALRGIGMTAFELRDYVGAYLGLSAALAETRRALDFEQRAQVEALLRRVNGLIARYTVAHLGEAATVNVDGVRQTLQDGYVLMTVGEHRVIVSLPDGRRATGSWIVRGGEEGPLPIEPPSVDIQPEAVAEAATVHERSPAPVTTEREPASGVGRTVGWVSLGSGVALVVAGAALVRVGRTDVDFLETADDGTVWEDVERLYERSPRFIRGGTAMLVLGGAAAATGLVLVLRGGDQEDQDDRDGEEASSAAPARGPQVQARVAPSRATLEVTW